MSDAHPFALHPPSFEQPAFVAQDAVLVGRVHVGPQASVWFGTVARGDVESITVGPGANVQDGCVLHADPGHPCEIGPHATIGHRAVVHGASIGEHALIGIGAVVLNGACVGEYAMIGAGALVPEGAQIPPRTLAVGIPAKVKRELSEGEIEMLRFSAQHYIELGQAYQAKGFGRADL